MTTWTMRFAALLCLLAGSACARPSPLCERPEVLQEVARVVRQWDPYNTVDDLYVDEAPGPEPHHLVCFVAVRGVEYRPYRGGYSQVPTVAWRRFDLMVEGNRFTVAVQR